MKRTEKVAALSIGSNSTLIVLKIVAGIMSGSVSIVSEAIHSGMDLLASVIAFLSVRISNNPADTEHPYGHGKAENVSGVVEGILIFVAAGLIIKEAIDKIITPTEMKETTVAIVVMFIAVVVNIIVSKILYKVAKEEDSMALQADALHLKTDVYTSLGVAVGLLLIKLTGFVILDPIVAIAVALLIVKEAWHLVYTAFQPLMDVTLSEEELKKIVDLLKSYYPEVINAHKLRTRKSGSVRIIDFHLIVDSSMSVTAAHDLCEEIEIRLEEELKNCDIQIHIEPESHLASTKKSNLW
jgi:cation diffusion facilitator family transporter